VKKKIRIVLSIQVKKKMIKKLFMCICIVLSIFLLSSFNSNGGQEEKNIKTTQEEKSIETNKPLSLADEDSLSESGNEEIVIGNLQTDGYVLSIEENTIGRDKSISVEALNEEEKAKIENPDRYELLGEPLKFRTDDEEAGFFAGEVKYTVPIPEEVSQDLSQIDSLVFVYYDDARDEARYLFPDEYDEQTRSFSIDLPHFSFWGPAKLTDKEKIEVYLDKYSMNEAIRRSDLQQAASALEPYLKAKLKNLQMTEEVTKEVIWDCIDIFVGHYAKKPGEKLADKIADQKYMFDQTFRDVSSTEDIEHFKSLLGTTSEAATRAGIGIFRSAYENDIEKFTEQFETIIAQNYLSHIIQNLDEKNPRKKYFGPIGAVVGFSSSLGEATAYLTEGQYEEGFKALIPVAQDIIKGAKPGAAVAVNAAKFAVAHSQRAWTNWKSNRVEELYQIYKNGKDGLFNNEVIAQNEESFINYLDFGSGFIPGRMIKRFYDMDKVAETCELYGWGPMEYDELPKDKKEEFNRRAQEGLLEYFRTRLSQELEAERIKEDERVCIERMLEGDGCLRSPNCRDFFGEDSWEDYDITNRLHRLMNIRNNISGFVNLEKLQKDQEYWKKRGERYYNWGDILDAWVYCMSEHMPDKDTAIRKFKERLRSSGYLHPDYMRTTLYPTLDQLVGDYSGEMIEEEAVFTELAFVKYTPSLPDEEPVDIKKYTEEWNSINKGTVYYQDLLKITKIDDRHGRIQIYIRPGFFDFEYSDKDGLIVSTAHDIGEKYPWYPQNMIIGKFNLQASCSDDGSKIELDGTYQDIRGISDITSTEGENFSHFYTLSVHYEKSFDSDD
jgi:hypothetical protein